MADPTPITPELVRQAAAASREGARLVACPAAAIISVRARDGALERVAATLGIDTLPAPNTARATTLGDCLWLRPDEWYVVGAHATRGTMLQRLDAAVGPDDGSAVDVSASRWQLELSGPAARDVLASCCPLDLHPGVFGLGQCAQTVVGRAPVLLHLAGDSPRWRLYVRPSLTAYVVAWLTDAIVGA